MKRINDKILLDDKELKLLVKEGYDRGIIFGCKVNATKGFRPLSGSYISQ